MIPDHISALIREANEARIPVISEERPLAAGDIRCVNSGSLDRLVLILKIDAKSQTAQVALLHGYPEFATDCDLIVRSGKSALPFDFVLQTDLRSVVLLPSIGRFVGVAETALVTASLRGVGSQPPTSHVSWGPALLGPLDARWDFKISEADQMRAICSPAVIALLDEMSSWRYDIENINEAFQKPVDDVLELQVAMLDLWVSDGESHVMTPEYMVFLFDKGLLNESAWINVRNGAGELFYAAVLIPLVEVARSEWGHRYSDPVTRVGIAELRAELRELQTT